MWWKCFQIRSSTTTVLTIVALAQKVWKIPYYCFTARNQRFGTLPGSCLSALPHDNLKFGMEAWFATGTILVQYYLLRWSVWSHNSEYHISDIGDQVLNEITQLTYFYFYSNEYYSEDKKKHWENDRNVIDHKEEYSSNRANWDSIKESSRKAILNHV